MDESVVLYVTVFCRFCCLLQGNLEYSITIFIVTIYKHQLNVTNHKKIDKLMKKWKKLNWWEMNNSTVQSGVTVQQQMKSC